MTSDSSSSISFKKYDQDIIQGLFDQYFVQLVFFAKNYIPDEETAKDMVQNAILALIESSPKFNNIDNFKAYLYRSVKNECLQFIRHKKVRERYEVTILKESEEREVYQEYVLEEEIYGLLMQEIDALPGQCQKVYTLALDGKSNQEIAEILSIGIETVKTYKKTGKQILRERLKGIVSSQLTAILSVI